MTRVTAWPVAPLERVCVSGGVVRGPFGGSLKKSDFVQSGFQVYEQRHAIGATAKGGRYFVTLQKYAQMKRFAVSPGDFLVSCSGTIGRIFQVPLGAPEGIINQALLKLTVDTSVVDPEYFLHYFSWDRFQEQILDNTHGGAMKNLVGMSMFRTTPIVLPPLGEQRRMAEALSRAGDLIVTLERMIVKKQAIKQSMMQELLTGKTRLPGFTEPWSATTLGALGTFLKGRGVKRDDVRSTGIRCVRYGELYTAFHDYTVEAISFVSPEVATTALPLKTGDVLFAGSGETREEIGKCVAYVGPTPAVAGGDVIVLRGEECNPIYLALLANTPEVVSQKARAGQGDAVVHVYSHALAAMEVKLPSREEQDAVAQAFIEVDSEIGVLRRRLRKARNVKQGMIQELLTGRTRLPVTEGAA